MIVAADSRKIPLADESVQCVVTSPPYWRLRRYAGNQELVWDGWRGAYGLEPSVDMYVSHSIQILEEIRRVLRPDGVVFWNVGDSYVYDWLGNGSSSPKQKSNKGSCFDAPEKIFRGHLKPKDLCLIPARVALAAQAAGWWVRSMIVWSKPNPMPESVGDRPTDAYENIIMLTKSEIYYWDAEAVKEQAIREGETVKVSARSLSAGQARAIGIKPSGNGKPGSTMKIHGRNLRNVWTLPTQPGAYLACRCGVVFASRRALPARIVADGTGTRTEHQCTHCLSWEQWQEHFAAFPEEIPRRCILAASRPQDLILDPFGGTGTTGRVALALGRRAILLDIGYQDAYRRLAETRLRKVQLEAFP